MILPSFKLKWKMLAPLRAQMHSLQAYIYRECFKNQMALPAESAGVTPGNRTTRCFYCPKSVKDKLIALRDSDEAEARKKRKKEIAEAELARSVQAKLEHQGVGKQVVYGAADVDLAWTKAIVSTAIPFSFADNDLLSATEPGPVSNQYKHKN
eukprot:CAMPEP_0175905476 /NCGR_PEP_ID=MMETSP0108-20121206/5032_1 /TAXON_ID=195067 ORGANISM="Goniomonas pacifica, Strain CCMP1869" /NCGR_SAMPLE_ID=MMETSP0108 /ASSEMBLY_ACC=CAM_ASM_000204 /LENGTH=152 /DNA_ID=CAMNT_0017227361 /DNA_START=51 /DNA_END=507 /DNA_ORIENTATION=-